MGKSNLGRKGFLSAYNFQDTSITEGSQGKDSRQEVNMEAGTEAKAMEEPRRLACSTWLAQPVFSTTQDQLPRGGTAPMGWVLRC